MAKASKMNRGFTGSTKNHPDNSPKMVKLSGGHAFVNFLPMESLCGKRLSGWGYGFNEDVTCSACKELMTQE